MLILDNHGLVRDDRVLIFNDAVEVVDHSLMRITEKPLSFREHVVRLRKLQLVRRNCLHRCRQLLGDLKNVVVFVGHDAFQGVSECAQYPPL